MPEQHHLPPAASWQEMRYLLSFPFLSPIRKKSGRWKVLRKFLTAHGLGVSISMKKIFLQTTPWSQKHTLKCILRSLSHPVRCLCSSVTGKAQWQDASSSQGSDGSSGT